MKRFESGHVVSGRPRSNPAQRLLTICALIVASGCAQCAPEKVGTGVARLTIRNVGAMATLANADTACGFAAPAVLSAPTVDGMIGGQGSLTFSIVDCVIDSAAGAEYSKDCAEATSTASGKVTLTARRTVKGTLTGNPASPIIPSGPDAVTVTIEKATFENFKVVSSTSKSILTMISGSLSAKVSPRLAVSGTTGACAVATPNVTFSDVKYTASKVHVETADNMFDVDVDESLLSAQNGVNGEKTNQLSGTVSVWGGAVPALGATDATGLDPDFNLARFDAAYACNPALAQPLSYTCADLRPRLAGGVARLSVRTLGTVTSMLDANSTCGFSSAAVAGNPTFTGAVGADGSTATFTIGTGCSVTLPPDTLLSTDCAGVETRGSGTVSVTGTKRVTGFRTGNPQKPIIPTSPGPAAFDLVLTFTNFQVKSSASTSSMLIKVGTLTGEVAPRTAIDATTGACSISTPISAFSNLSWANARVLLNSDGNNFDLAVTASNLDAQNGTKGTVSNLVSGQVTVDGTSYPLATAGEPLDTTFVQATFDASYACKPNLVVPPVDAACSFRRPLGIAAARLLVKTLATSTSMVNKNTTCGFAANAVLSAPTNVTGAAGSPGSITWAVVDCTLGPIPADTTISTNCLGGVTKVGGTAVANGTKTVNGLRANNPPIIPIARDAATLAMTSMVYTGFRVYDLAAGATVPTSSSTITGAAVVTLKPIGGESTANPSVFSVSTPVAGVEGLTMASGTITIESEGNRFDLALTNVTLNAFVASYSGQSNSVSGSLTVDGQPVTVAATALDPGFVQATFDSTYVCTPDLVAVVPSP